MATSNRAKNKRSQEVLLGFPATDGVAAYDNSLNLNVGAAEVDISGLLSGEATAAYPLETVVDPLIRGQFQSDGAPMAVDDQGMNGTIPVQHRAVTDATTALLHDIIHKTGYAASTLKSTVQYSPRIHFDLKYIDRNPNNPADVHQRVFRQAYFTNAEIAPGDPNVLNLTWTCRRTRLTSNDVA